MDKWNYSLCRFTSDYYSFENKPIEEQLKILKKYYKIGSEFIEIFNIREPELDHLNYNVTIINHIIFDSKLYLIKIRYNENFKKETNIHPVWLLPNKWANRNKIIDKLLD